MNLHDEISERRCDDLQKLDRFIGFADLKCTDDGVGHDFEIRCRHLDREQNGHGEAIEDIVNSSTSESTSKYVLILNLCDMKME